MNNDDIIRIAKCSCLFASREYKSKKLKTKSKVKKLLNLMEYYFDINILV